MSKAAPKHRVVFVDRARRALALLASSARRSVSLDRIGARSRTALFCILAVSSALVAAGCGGDNEPSSAKELTSFAFLSVNNPGLAADVTATIDGTVITATVPFGTNVTALEATFQTAGASVTVDGVAQTSGSTTNDFTSLVTYAVTSADNSTRDYVVTVTVATSSTKDLSAFAFLASNNAGLAADVTATITGMAITATVPFGTDVTTLEASFQTTGASVAVSGVVQTSSATPNDFTSPVTYTVTAADHSTRNYTVTVTVAASSAKDLTAFSFLSANNSGLPANVTATITGTTITATVPFGTTVTALKATFSTSGASVTVGVVAQSSGATANNFTSLVTYTVTAADNSTRSYAVTITVAASSAKDLTAFSFLSVNNSGLTADVMATITGTTISATVPYGTTVTALKATFSTSGASVTVGTVVQVSGVTANDFTGAVIYRVTAADSSTKDYTASVTVAANPANDLTAFSFLSVNNSGLAADVAATITGTTISATVPYGTTVTALKATFSTNGASVTVGGVTQVSSVTANDFSSAVVFRVTAADNSTRDYTVTMRSFAAKVEFTTGSAPVAVAIGDFNHDGKPDLAVANFHSDTVSVFLDTTATGSAVPSFAARLDFPTGSLPYSVAIGDLDGDGTPDLAVANRNSNTVSVLLNTTPPGSTAPSFAPRVDFATGMDPFSVAIGDLDGDGKLDLAVANERSGTVSVLRNTRAVGSTTPSFAATVDFMTGDSPLSVAIGDLDGDGKLDLVVADYNLNTVSILHNLTATGATTPSFATKVDFMTGSNPYSVAIGDVNSDGKPDIAVSNSNANSVSVLLNTATTGSMTPSFAAKVDFTTGSTSVFIAIGDLDGDGSPDLAIGNVNSNTVSVLINTTLPGSTTPSFGAKVDVTTGSSPHSLAIGDLNGDGKPDLAVATPGSSTVSVLLAR